MRAPPSIATTRRVWAAVSIEPQASCARLGERVGLAKGTVSAALRELKRLGYVQFAYAQTGRTIIVPFIEEDAMKWTR